MRRFGLLLVVGLAGCVSAPLTLAEDPMERAATCGAVRTLELREGKAGGGPVSFQGATEILHFAALHAAEDVVQLRPERIDGVRERAEALLPDLRGQNWPSLVEPCNAAFPETHKNPAPLPGDAFEAGMTCYALGDALGRALPVEFANERRDLSEMADRALAAAQPVLRERARGEDQEAARIASGYAARAIKAGRLTTLAGQCRRRFPAAG